MRTHRVFITGLGLITPIGIGKEAVCESLRAGRSGIRGLTRLDASLYGCQIAAEIPDFDPSLYLNKKQVRRFDRYSQLCVSAARLALRDAEIVPEKEDPERVGVFIGSALGGMFMAEEQHDVFRQRGLRHVNPMLGLSVFVAAGSSNVAIEFGFQGPASANGDSCASGPIAMGRALDALRLGRADMMIAGGVEAPLADLCFGAFDIIQAMTRENDPPERGCRPFDATRTGFVMGEAGALLVLETEEHMVRRGGVPYAELAGAAVTNDGHHMTAPRPDGVSASRAVRMALKDAGLTTDEVEFISAHGSGTPLNDRTETAVVKEVFADRAYHVPMSSTKSMHGHPLGASGAIEAAISCLAIQRGFVPPTINLRERDPECDLDYVGEGIRQQPVRTALSNSFGFGGINACLAFKEPS